MTVIRNTNERYGDPVVFDGRTINEAVANMQAAIRDCGLWFTDVVVSESDYELLEPAGVAEFEAHRRFMDSVEESLGVWGRQSKEVDR